MLKVEQLSVQSPTKTILTNMSLSLNEKEAVSIVGESGSGKSTLLKSLLGFPFGELEKTSGQIIFDGIQIEPQKRRQHLHFLGTDVTWISQHASVSFNNRRKIKAHYNDLVKSYGRKSSKLRSLEECLRLVEFKNPKDIIDKYPFELSGGMMQRVSIALALVANPKLLIADEPMSALDVVSKRELTELLKRLRKTEHVALLFSTHDISLAYELSDRIYIMKKGEFVEEGLTKNVLKSPQHPYTQKLLQAVPKLKRGETE
ncbi:ATP-binding cassette domain-containing protein [Granulicatella sp. zg-ZJ]|uniref:ATP-binding cassette domain-containing protein n=1 Tax=unclassified Granulicatella TaxID=2630493 RepID=UPI0013BF36AB|nr:MULTISPECIES: ABC transporter ATP-binding protein [unclassified Granulicatella]MBS4749809.1 ABC transporter ATP-binding protein [Carnobacteriaceae bacterium zg-ZUI78]NEW61917.1 ATP-binding cassette domain-containing protein [Granulicatella sp. zg-ZJ]NEW66251.1 ATP-binding cassette domain-containing protein [Granulicatella sp. zg-84]QMI85909.1 ABC transporter ATP-binding protein [Carnobacteriaceae bacterium zg-84]